MDNERNTINQSLTCVELNDSLGSVGVRVGDGGKLRIFIYRVINLKHGENWHLFETISPGKLFNQRKKPSARYVLSWSFFLKHFYIFRTKNTELLLRKTKIKKD